MSEKSETVRAEFLEDYKNKAGRSTGKKYRLLKPTVIGYLVYEPGNINQKPWLHFNNNMVLQDRYRLQAHALKAINAAKPDLDAASHQPIAANMVRNPVDTLLSHPSIRTLGDRELLSYIFQLPNAPDYVLELATRYDTALNEMDIRLLELQAVTKELEQLPVKRLPTNPLPKLPLIPNED